MKQVIIYEDGGNEQIIGVFNSFKEAMEWAKEDVAYVYGDDAQAVEFSNGYELPDEGCSWTVKPLTVI